MDPNIPTPPTQNDISVVQPNLHQPVNSTPSPKSKWKLILFIIIILIIVGVGAYYLGTRQDKVIVQNQQQIVAPTITQSVSTPTPDPIADWKTFKSPDYNISFRYPSDWVISEDGLKDPSKSLTTVSKKDSQSEGRYRVILLIRNDISYGGAGGAFSNFQHYDTFLVNGKTAYIIGDDDDSANFSTYLLSSCAPKKCLFNIPNTDLKIDFYGDHYTPGDQAVEPFPKNDPRTEIVREILKTISF